MVVIVGNIHLAETVAGIVAMHFQYANFKAPVAGNTQITEHPAEGELTGKDSKLAI